MLLTFTSGLLDAVGFVGLGRVFPSLMTGNVAFVGMAIAGYEGVSAPRSLVALLSFATGAAIGGRLANQMKQATHRRWLSIVTALEVVFLLVAVGFALGYDYTSATPESSLYGIIFGTALAMGVRSATVLRLSVPDLKTTVLTLTIANLSADSSLAGGTNPRLGRRLASLVSLSAGAGVGILALQAQGAWLPLAMAAGLIVVATAIYVAHPASLTVGWGKKK
jgi:uncharacterized membrane protein YoaK (UPF0700 family)